MKKQKEYILEVLKKNDLKATPQRVKILEILIDSGHTTIDEIYDEIKKELPSISLATVYSNINLLLKNNIIKTVKLSGSKILYEFNETDHIHLVCEICNSIKDIEIDENDIINFFEKAIGIKPKKFETTLYYICEKCQ
ncbi:peroxide stress regulator [Deferribacter desulfuricans SSM1]|uniref:Peroxide stress regulator n=1 Tax=Deferribacter desulfuricans (strain DSM 14783 / JCM 11476 / NBRC 101012 / SSM1) TaxID=639282 RepID=D3P8I6_DEFDS|nr:Fur family transcriptional regulator [Deferribacter desulfuricans]BAI81026.1 peroxide stress regulator [Deferribacter desulfuricans SSM1]